MLAILLVIAPFVMLVKLGKLLTSVHSNIKLCDSIEPEAILGALIEHLTNAVFLFTASIIAVFIWFLLRLVMVVPEPRIQESRYNGLTTDECDELRQIPFLDEPIMTDDECSICCDSLKLSDKAAIFKVPGACQHRFHKDCIFQWLKKEAKCPLCRSDIRP